MDPDLASLRADYQRGGLAEPDLAADPIAQFERWFEQAREAGIAEPNAMVLATVSPDRQPSARAVLLKEVGADGFAFYTNHDSAKAHDLAGNPRCALTFTWLELQRQVRVQGTARRVDRERVESYFATRPRDSQLGAWASAQSSVVSGREELEAAFARVAEEFAGRPVPCPPYWGGYLVRPHRVEFWQGRHGRMHDRLAFVRDGPAWRVERLAP